MLGVEGSGNWRDELLKYLARLGNIGDWDGFVEVLPTIRSRMGGKADASVYDAFLIDFAQYATPTMAEDLHKEMREDDVFIEASMYAKIILRLGRNGFFDAAERWFKRMLAAGHDPEVAVYATMVDGYASRGLSKDAARWFENILAAGFKPNVVVYVALLRASCKNGDPEEAAQLLEAMREAQIEPTKEAYDLAIGSCQRHGDIEKAEAFFQLMLDSRDYARLNRRTFKLMLQVAAEARDVKGAERYYEDVGRCSEFFGAPDQSDRMALIWAWRGRLAGQRRIKALEAQWAAEAQAAGRPWRGLPSAEAVEKAAREAAKAPEALERKSLQYSMGTETGSVELMNTRRLRPRIRR